MTAFGFQITNTVAILLEHWSSWSRNFLVEYSCLKWFTKQRVTPIPKIQFDWRKGDNLQLHSKEICRKIGMCILGKLKPRKCSSPDGSQGLISKAFGHLPDITISLPKDRTALVKSHLSFLANWVLLHSVGLHAFVNVSLKCWLYQIYSPWYYYTIRSGLTV